MPEDTRTHAHTDVRTFSVVAFIFLFICTNDRLLCVPTRIRAHKMALNNFFFEQTIQRPKINSRLNICAYQTCMHVRACVRLCICIENWKGKNRTV